MLQNFYCFVKNEGISDMQRQIEYVGNHRGSICAIRLKMRYFAL